MDFLSKLDKPDQFNFSDLSVFAFVEAKLLDPKLEVEKLMAFFSRENRFVWYSARVRILFSVNFLFDLNEANFLFSWPILADFNDRRRFWLWLKLSLIFRAWIRFEENISVYMAFFGVTSLRFDNWPNFLFSCWVCIRFCSFVFEKERIAIRIEKLWWWSKNYNKDKFQKMNIPKKSWKLLISFAINLLFDKSLQLTL